MSLHGESHVMFNFKIHLINCYQVCSHWFLLHVLSSFFILIFSKTFLSLLFFHENILSFSLWTQDDESQVFKGIHLLTTFTIEFTVICFLVYLWFDFFTSSFPNIPTHSINICINIYTESSFLMKEKIKLSKHFNKK